MGSTSAFSTRMRFAAAAVLFAAAGLLAWRLASSAAPASAVGRGPKHVAYATFAMG